ncbi:MAG: DUF1972 domain-containing protein [Crocinitomicaceae bacterium]|nr:DUF1972 domain-containing protein [Crocinitomicaceae bacterium]
MKRIAIVGSVGVPANYGGFETLTENLVEHLSRSNEITVFCSGRTYSRSKRKAYHKGARLKFVPVKANGVQSILYDYISIIWSLFYADTILILGVSGCTLLPFVRFFTKKKIVVNIDGLEWRRKKWNKFARWFLRLSEGLAIKCSHAHITDNKAIQRYTSMYYGQIGHVIAYGGNQRREKGRDALFMKKYSFLVGDYYIKVARIEPENNIELILKAFISSDLQLVIVGNWKNSEYSRDLYELYSGHVNIFLLEPVYENAEIDFLREHAKAYIHGHEAGGTNPSLVEAMCLGIPVYAYDVSFNLETTKSKAIYFKSSKDLIEKIKGTIPVELKMNTVNMILVARKHYNWDKIVNQYDTLIEEVYSKGLKKKLVERIDRSDRIRLRTRDFETIVRTRGVKF